MPIFKSYKKESRTDWGIDLEPNVSPNHEQLKLGAFLRMADAMEAMAKSHTGLVEEKERYRKWYNEAREMRDRAYRQVQSLRGVITRLKKNKGKYHVK